MRRGTTLMLNILASFAEFEREMMAPRIAGAALVRWVQTLALRASYQE